MKHKIPWSAAGACAGMLLLILDGKTAADSAREGVELCMQTVIPSLFPFLVLSALLLECPSFPLLMPLGRLCGVPGGAEALLLPAFLGGYPVGAQSVASAYRSGALGREDAERMLAFCNNAGPAFLFGMAPALFPRPWMVWALWGIHLASALLVSLLIPAKASASSLPERTHTPDGLASSLRVMGLICGWVILFRVFIGFLKGWLFFCIPTEYQVLLTGLLELTNGFCQLPLLDSMALRFTMCSAFLALGGLCVTMQTLAVTRGLSLKWYGLGKLMQLFISLFLCGCLFIGGRMAVPAALLILITLLVRKQKKGRIPPQSGV